jgi:uncharacterized YccA/Bax inhibitor family protein
MILNIIASILVFLCMGIAAFLIYIDSDSRKDWRVNPGLLIWLMNMALILTLIFF